jgi:leucyl aminopeptidase
MLDSTSADIRNANTDSPAGGAITAALFLEEFAGRETPWIHLDIPSFHHKPDPGHPEGADAFGLRSSFALIRERFQG